MLEKDDQECRKTEPTDSCYMINARTTMSLCHLGTLHSTVQAAGDNTVC